MMRRLKLLFLFLLVVNGLSAQDTFQKKELEWWQNARYGMFIHWGPVTRYGGEISWTREKFGKAKYDSLYKGFNPVKFDPKQWVSLAKEAGMKYMVFTAKHHDGFCEWNTKTTSYNIMNTPFGRDVCRELADAAHKADLPICWYFSPADWKDEDCRNPKFNDRFSDRVLKQITELLSNYGKISLLWIDYEGSPSPVDPSKIYQLAKKLQPGIIVNNRLDVFHTDESHSYIGKNGDYATPEGFVAGYGAIPWETCTNLGHQWAWRPKDTPRPIKEAITTLLKCVGGNGNLLLNVGPDSLGQIPVDFADRLKELGNWTKSHREAIYGTHGGPYTPTADYVCTRKDHSIFLNVFRFTQGDTITLPYLNASIQKVTLLNGKQIPCITNMATISSPDKQKTSGSIPGRFLKFVVKPSDREEIATMIRIDIKENSETLKLIPPFGISGSLAYQCKAVASSSIGQFLHDPSAAFDDNVNTFWKLGRRKDANFSSFIGKLLNYKDPETFKLYDSAGWLEVDLGEAKTVRGIKVSEATFLNSVIKSFEIQYKKGDQWVTIAQSKNNIKSAGDYTFSVDPVKARYFRLVIIEREGFSGIREFQLFDKPIQPADKKS